MSKSDKCCYGCDEREMGCHSWCERYKRYLEKNEVIKARKRADADYHGYANGVVADRKDARAKLRKNRAGMSSPTGR